MGLLSNICHEGNTGIFEYYNSNTDYHRNLNSYLQTNYSCTYVSEYSGQYIYNKNVTTVYNLFTQLKNMNWSYNGSRIGTGLGCIQWTFNRTYTLINIYREVNGNSSSITQEQALTAEGLMISRELSGAYIDVYKNWKIENSPNLNSENAAYQAAYDICVNYEKPTDMYNKGDTRGNFAKLIYADIVQ